MKDNISDFEEYKERLEAAGAADTLAQEIIKAAYLDITQEINTVLAFSKGFTKGGKFYFKQPQDSEGREKMYLLAHLCELHGNNLLAVSKAIIRATGAPDKEDMQKALMAAEALNDEYRATHETILQREAEKHLKAFETMKGGSDE